MYGEKINVANKIISEQDLLDIFYKMWEEMEKYKNLWKLETNQNQVYEYQYQTWTCKDFNGTFKFSVHFYDDTTVEFDNYQNFVSIFNARIHDIKDIYVRYHYSYSVQRPGETSEYYSQGINMWIYETKINMDISLSNADKKMDAVYVYIKDKIMEAPEKFDRVIQKKGQITTKITFALGAIPATIIALLLMFVPEVRQFYGMTYVLFPIIVVFLSYFIGGTVFGNKIDRLYQNIIPDKKYVGYDSGKGTSIYKDDIDKFIETSEIIIGKNVDNLKNRKEIIELEQKYSKYLPYELLGILILSVIAVIIGKI